MFFQVGGLGDVVTGLGRACQARGHNVAVMMPFYESLPKDQIEGLKHEMDIDVPKGFRWDGELRLGEWLENPVFIHTPEFHSPHNNHGSVGWLLLKTGALRTSVFWGKISGVPTYLIRPADWNSCSIFRGGRIYGGSYDEKEAYLYLCR